MRKWQLGAAGFLLLATAAFFLLFRLRHQPALLNPPQPDTVRVHFSGGRIETYPNSRLDGFKWIALKSQTYNPTFKKQLTLTAAAFVGLRKYAVPDPPTLVTLESHLRACGQYTHHSFFLHEQFADHLSQLNFFFGGSEHARTPAEWIEANLNSIRTNRVVIGPAGSRKLISCAIVVSQNSIHLIPESVLLKHFVKHSAQANSRGGELNPQPF